MEMFFTVNYGNLEKIESVILRPAPNFSIKNVVVFGSRSFKNGMRYDSLKEVPYKTNKYSDLDIVGKVCIETSDYLVFNYSDISRKINVEIFMSYQHIHKLRDVFSKCLKAVQNKCIINKEKQKMFIKTKGNYYINPDFEEWYLSVNNLIGGKSMNFVLDLKEIEEINGDVTTVPAIEILFNDEDISVTLDKESLDAVSYFLDNFDLLSSSQNLSLMSYLTQMANGLNLENKTYSKAMGGKLLKKVKPVSKKKKQAPEITGDEDFMKIEDTDEEEIPFN